MKLAILNYYSGINQRGAETFVQELTNQLVAHDVVVKVFKGTEVSLPRFLMTPDKPGKPSLLRRLFLTRAKLAEALFTLKILTRLRAFNPDVIMPINSGWQALIISLYCRIAHKKLVISGQSGLGWDDRWNLAVFPHLFVSPTKTGADWAKRVSLWDTKIVTIPNGVDLQQFGPVGKSLYKNKLTKPIIICVGAMEKPKRIYETIRAVSLTSASLLLVGSGEEETAVDGLANGLLGQKRYLRLSVPHSKMPDIYRSANLFTLCSMGTEAFGIAYLEAMATGLGCVVTDDPSRHEIVGNAGLYVTNPNNPREYADALNRALKKNWQKQAIRQAQVFSWDRVAQHYLDEINK